MLPAASVPTLTVTGRGRVSVAADRVVFTIHLSALAASAEETEAQLALLRGRLLDCLGQAEVPSRRIRSSSMQLQPEHDYADNRWSYRGIRGTETITIRVPISAGRSTQIVKALAGELRHLRVSVAYLARNTAAGRAGALRRAVADARHQAEVIAEASGLAVGPLLSITHRGEPSEGAGVVYDALAGAAPAPEVAPLATTCDAQVEMVWTLLKP